MKLCYVADARSPIAQNWIGYFVRQGHQVHVLSSYPCEPETLPGATVHSLPIGFSQLAPRRPGRADGAAPILSTFAPLLRSIQGGALGGSARRVRAWLAPLDLRRHVPRAASLIATLQPDLVHAMRIPFEGIFAAQATPPTTPLLVSVWGNDFTLFAARNPLIGALTRQALRRADALHSDCERDLRLARERWGFAAKPATVLPGAGGIQRDLFSPGPADAALRARLAIPDGAAVVINPRGFRSYVCNEAFFRAIPAVLSEQPETVFLCSSMAGNPVAEGWARRLGVERQVRLLPPVARDEMAALFRLATVTVSPSQHDGTPNTLLEAMACGCFPVAGDIPSVREWIVDGENGLLCDPARPDALAAQMVRALRDDGLRQRARLQNDRLITERADFGHVMAQAEQFYQRVAAATPQES